MGASTAPRCPGESISGTTVMCSRAASATIRRTWALVRCGLETISGWRVGLDPEALVVGEVQAELVELEVGHLAQPVLDPAGGEVLAGDVEVEAALRPGRAVAHDALGHRAVGPSPPA